MLELCVAYAAGSIFGPREIDMPMYTLLDGKIQKARAQLGYTIETATNAAPSITCHECGRTSFNESDIKHKYCGYCHKYHEDTQAKPS